MFLAIEYGRIYQFCTGHLNLEMITMVDFFSFCFVFLYDLKPSCVHTGARKDKIRVCYKNIIATISDHNNIV